MTRDIDDAYGKAYEKPYMRSKDWWAIYRDQPVKVTITGFTTLELYNPKSNEDKLTGAITTLEFQGKPIPINNVAHDWMQKTYGHEYWKKPEVIGSVLTLKCEVKHRKDGEQNIIRIVGNDEKASQPIGERNEKAFVTDLAKLGVSLEDFFWWLAQTGQRALATTLQTTPVPDWPYSTITAMKQYANQVRDGDKGTKRPPATKPAAHPTPAAPSTPATKPGFWKMRCPDCDHEIGGAGHQPELVTCAACGFKIDNRPA